MKTYNVHYAKTHLSRLIEAVAKGDEIIIANAGKPVAKLVPIQTSQEKRVLGRLAGSVTESPDCWTHDQELEDLFYAEPKASSLRRVAEPRKKKG